MHTEADVLLNHSSLGWVKMQKYLGIDEQLANASLRPSENE